MTVIIAGISKNSVVVVGDRMNSMEGKKYQQKNPKIYPIANNMVIGIAGTSGFEERFINPKGNFKTVKDAFEQVKDSYYKLRKDLIVDRFLHSSGFDTWDDFVEVASTTPDFFASYIDDIEHFDPDLKILIAGINTEPHIYGVGNPGDGANFDECGFYAIGTGADYAMNMLQFLDYSKNVKLEDAIFQIYFAKKFAELSLNVGEKTDIFVVNSKEVKRVDEKPYKAKFRRVMGKMRVKSGEEVP